VIGWLVVGSGVISFGIIVVAWSTAAAPFSIVLPKAPTPAEKTAGAELSHYLERAAKEKLTVKGRAPVRFLIGDSPVCYAQAGGRQLL